MGSTVFDETHPVPGLVLTSFFVPEFLKTLLALRSTCTGIENSQVATF
jgi:hypothetical protein